MNFNFSNNKKIFVENDFVLENKEHLPLMQFELFKQFQEIEHCFTTKLGGVSSGIYDSLNLSFSRGDDRNCVRENYRRVGEFFGKGLDAFVTSDQTHTTNVLRVTSKDAGSGLVFERPYSDIDGLVTNEKGIILSTFYADCVPLYFYDPVNKAIGLSHSGWRGTLNRMGQVTIEALSKEFGSKPEDIYVAIGPSICQKCYEVSEEVAEQFGEEFSDYKDEIIAPGNVGHAYLDLWNTNKYVMLEAGIKPEHIVVTNVCTSCNHELLYSHRRTQGKRGNLGAFLMLK